MKKLLVALIVIMLFAVTPAYAFGLSKGIKAGFCFANLNGDDVSDGGSSKSALCGGVFANLDFFMLEIQPEILYIQRRIDFNQNPFTGMEMAVPYHVKMNYLEIPILAKAKMPIPGVIKPNLFAGPYFALNLTAQGHFDTEDPEDLEFIKGTDIGVALGVGVDLSLLVMKVTLDGRYTFGLNSIHEEGNDIKNSSFAVMLGIAF